MSRMLGALLVQRFRPSAEELRKLSYAPAVALSAGEVAHRYRGIDGDAWPEDLTSVQHPDGLANVSHWHELKTVAEEHSDENVMLDAVVLADDAHAVIHEDLRDVVFLGYDVGFYNEYGVFSSIFNEAIYSPLEALRKFASRLNDSLLFADETEVGLYCAARESLRLAHADVEDEDCHPIAIFGAHR